MSKPRSLTPERRSFLTRLNTGAASLLGLAAGGVALAQVKTPAAKWEPARHEKDDWLDQTQAKHRMLFDTTTPENFADAITFASNFLRANLDPYGVRADELSIVIVARHRSAPFGYNDAMWAKYGMPLAARAKVDDPKTRLPPKMNLFNAAGYGDILGSRGTTLDVLAQQGVQVAVCSLSTRAYAGVIAGAMGGNADAIFAEITSNLVAKGRMVPAGIVTVNRAQERGYTLTVG